MNGTIDDAQPFPAMTRSLLGLFVLLLSGILFAETPALTRINEVLASGEKPVRVVCFGDSVTGVYYHTGGLRAYTDLLGDALRQIHPRASVTLINAGMSGHTTTNGLGRLMQSVLVHKPHLVTVMFGLNDVAKLPIAAYRKNLIEIVSKCRASGAEVVLCTPNTVLTTPDRPFEKVIAYCEVVRSVSRELNVPLCDTFAALEAVKTRAPDAWRLAMSDEIHPNLSGHRRIAEQLALTITGDATTLEDTGPSLPLLDHTFKRLKAGEAVKVLAMPPFDTLIGDALREVVPGANIATIPWPTEGLSRYQLMKDASHRVRPLVPDLVVVAVPRTAGAKDREEFIRTQMWITANSLSRGKREWDVLVVHPSVVEPVTEAPEEDGMIRLITAAQDLPLLDRVTGDSRDAKAILVEWLTGAKGP